MVSSPRVVSPQNSSSTITNTNSPIPITRSEPINPYPTTCVTTDAASFKQVVQILTGLPERTAHRHDPTRNNPNPIPPMRSAGSVRKDQYKPSSSRLYERRSSFKNSKMGPLAQARSGFHPGWTTRPEVLSPSLLDFPSLVLSPVTPLIPDPFKRDLSGLDVEAEEKAIKEKGFFLHPSPRESEQPRLLTLFPLTSPRASEGSLP